MVATPDYGLSTDATLGGNNPSDIISPSEKAIKTYVDNHAGGGSEWGSITGTLSDQTDLQNALNEKQDQLTAGENITIEEQQEGWTTAVQDSNLGSHSWSAVAYGNNKFVALSDQGYISVSTDGVTWVQAEVPSSSFETAAFTSLAYGNNKFVAIGYSGYVSTSTDGTTWTTAVQDSNLGYNSWIGALAYGNNKFVAVGSDGYISTSTDGTTWTTASRNSNLGVTGGWDSLTYNGNKFLVVSYRGDISTSTDGVNWDYPTSVFGTTSGEWSIAYGNDKFIAIGMEGYVSTSTDGTTWTPAVQDTNLGDNSWSTITYGNNKFVAIGNSGAVSQYLVGGTIISATGGGGTWGSITGTLSSQTDLQAALNAKYDSSNPAGYISGITSSDVTTALGYTPGTVSSVNNIQPVNGNVTLSIPVVDQTYSSISANAQSGVAVAQALTNKTLVIMRDWSVS